MINLYDIDSSKKVGTGPHGSLMKSDVKTYIDANNLQPKVNLVEKTPSPPPHTLPPTPSSSQYIDIELTNIREVIAKRLVLSKVRNFFKKSNKNH
jgi:pyruvate/2-oxoglutarate dehydrogenase complex dihydrolipoamide acyltransferase (E2) component